MADHSEDHTESCETTESLTWVFFPEAITRLESDLSDGKKKLDNAFEESAAKHASIEEYFGKAESVADVFSGILMQVIHHIARQIDSALEVPHDSVLQALLSNSQIDSLPLSCISDQLKDIGSKYNSAQKEFDNYKTAALQRYINFFDSK